MSETNAHKTMTQEFEVHSLPKTRLAISDMLREGQLKHMIHGFTEVDVTIPRQRIEEHKKVTGERISFTAFIATCLAQAVDENKTVHGYLDWRRQLVIFRDVDINTQIEREIDGRKWVMPYVIRAANQKTLMDIHREIRAAQKIDVENAREYKQYHWYLMLPGFIRRFFWWFLRRAPHRTKQIAGTVGLTSIGMFGSGSGWGLPITTQTLLITLGGIAKKPGVVDDKIEIREFLSLTLSIDHDIVDGAPAARFSKRLKELIEGSYGLLE